MPSLADLLAATGRLLIALLFVPSGIGKVAAPKATLAYIAAAGLPAPFVAYLIAIAVEIGSSALLVLGYHTRLVGLGMAVFAIATALAFHHNFGDQAVDLNFLKNLAIAGGLLNVAAYGGGTCSLDARRKGRW